jgi:hypothetical protein
MFRKPVGLTLSYLSKVVYPLSDFNIYLYFVLRIFYNFLVNLVYMVPLYQEPLVIIQP